MEGILLVFVRTLVQQLIVSGFRDLKIASIFEDLLLLGGQLLRCHVARFGLRELLNILLLTLVDLLNGDVARFVVAKLSVVSLAKNWRQQLCLLGLVHGLKNVFRDYSLLVVGSADGIRLGGQI